MRSTVVAMDKHNAFAPSIWLMRGDKNSTLALLKLDRNAGAVDLAGLVWQVKYLTADGVANPVPLGKGDVLGDVLFVPWVIGPIPASVEGVTAFELEGLSEGNIVWQSGKRLIQVTDDLDAEPELDPDQLSEWQEFIERAMRAVPAAEQATENANTAAERADTAREDMEDFASILRDAVNAELTRIAAVGDAQGASVEAMGSAQKQVLETLGGGYVTAAAGSADAAAESAREAGASATEAGEKATAAARSANSAANSAAAAAGSASAAAGSASAAQTARTGAETAKAGAETARTGAEAAQRTTENTRDQAVQSIVAKTEEQIQRIPEVLYLSQQVDRLNADITNATFVDPNEAGRADQVPSWQEHEELSGMVGQLNESVADTFGSVVRSEYTAPAYTGENWVIDVGISAKQGEVVRIKMESYEGDGYIRTRLIGYDSSNAAHVYDNDIHLGDDKSYTVNSDTVKFVVVMIASGGQVGNNCVFTLITNGFGIAKELMDNRAEIAKKANKSDVIQYGDSERIRIGNTQFLKPMNLLDLTVGIDSGVVLNSRNPVPNAAYFATKPLYGFEPGKSYTMSNFKDNDTVWQAFVTSWDANNAYINNQNVGTVSGFPQSFVIPQNAKYIKVSATLTRMDTLMIIEGTKPSTHYESYNIPVANVPIVMDGVSRVFHVEKDGSGDFTRLVDAIEYAQQWMDSIVYLGAGIWNLLDELGTDYVESASNSKRGIYLKNRIHLIGSSRSVITAHYNGSNQQTMTWLAPFNSGEYGFTLENITLESSNLRYSVHDERDTGAEPYTNKYINCNFKNDNSNGGFRQCIGGGLGRDGHIYIRGCIFNSVTANHNSAVSYHNTWYRGGTGKSFIDIQNSIVKGTGTFRFSWFGDSTEMTQVLCANNSVGAPIQFVQETTDPNMGVAVDIVNVELYTWNNEIRSN